MRELHIEVESSMESTATAPPLCVGSRRSAGNKNKTKGVHLGKPQGWIFCMSLIPGMTKDEKKQTGPSTRARGPSAHSLVPPLDHLCNAFLHDTTLHLCSELRASRPRRFLGRHLRTRWQSFHRSHWRRYWRAPRGRHPTGHGLGTCRPVRRGTVGAGRRTALSAGGTCANWRHEGVLWSGPGWRNEGVVWRGSTPRVARYQDGRGSG